MKENLRNKTGITLVALVVTIIVLLILAGVTIALLLGDNGIIAKAQRAKEETERKTTEEQEGLSRLEEQMNDYLGEGGASAADVAAAPTEWYGKTVNYTVSDSTIQAALDTEGITWKIFYADSSHIYLIASDYVPNANIPKTKGNTTTLLSTNGTYKAYWSETALGDYYDSTTSTVTMNSLYQTLNKSHYDYLVANNSGAYPNNDNIKAVAYMLDTDAWSGYKDSAGKAEYVIGGPTIEMLMASYNQTHGDIREADNQPKYQAKVTETNPKYGYQISYDYGDSWHSCIEDKAAYLSPSDPLYTTVRGSSRRPESYWLASSSADYTNALLDVRYDGWVDFTSFAINSYGFRPLVSLKSNVKLQVQEDRTININ